MDFDAGKNIDDGLAGKINSGLLLPTDRAQIKTILETYPRPKNVDSLRIPVRDKELTDIDKSAFKRDRRLSGIQDKVTGSLNIVSSLLSDFKQKKNRDFS